MCALACGAWAAQQEDKGQRGKGQKEGQGIVVMKPSQAEWKQADKMPQGVMKALVCESKGGGAIYLVKFPAGTKVPAHTTAAEKVIHVHSGSLEVGQGPASAQPGKGQDQPGQVAGQTQTASDGDIIKISANTSYWLHAKGETLALVAMDAKSDASGQRSSEESENKVK